MNSKRERLLQDLQNMFSNDLNRKIFKQFIEYIRFPFFKNFEKNLKVNFNFPITFVVGLNGSGKSSLIHALYGSPVNYSIANYWFDTALDPIEYIKTNRHCLIYSYITEYSQKKVEVLKLRIQVRDKKTGKINLDYWEPSRPYVKYTMKSPSKDDDMRETSPSKDRWNAIKKSVYHLDFRYSLSAYDKYFYFGSKPNTKTLKSKQDIIRKYARKLKQTFELNEAVKFRTRTSDKPTILNMIERKKISEILGKSYCETQITKHNFYDRNEGFAIKYKTNSVSYSEAYAGSGEVAVVKLVHELMKIKDYSLVLLDEPETSLHPSAQKKLINFILEQTKKKKLQVVISTHSPDIIEDMPKEAIKIFYENQTTGKINILEKVSPENAFIHIGRSFSDKKVIFVEDNLAKILIEKIIDDIGNKGVFEVRYTPGGDSIIKQESMVVYSKDGDQKKFIVFDGDQKRGKINPDDITAGEKNKRDLETMIKSIVGGKIKFSFDSNRHDQEIELMLKYIKYHYENVFFLPKKKPEEIVWDKTILQKADIADHEKTEINLEIDFKEKFNLFAKYSLGNDTSKYNIIAFEYFLKRWIEFKNTDYQKIVDILEVIKGK